MTLRWCGRWRGRATNPRGSCPRSRRVLKSTRGPTAGPPAHPRRQPWTYQQQLYQRPKSILVEDETIGLGDSLAPVPWHLRVTSAPRTTTMSHRINGRVFKYIDYTEP
ncbi:unnamed protein product, partial [Ascophyllum nodosum]